MISASCADASGLADAVGDADALLAAEADADALADADADALADADAEALGMLATARVRMAETRGLEWESIVACSYIVGSCVLCSLSNIAERKGFSSLQNRTRIA